MSVNWKLRVGIIEKWHTQTACAEALGVPKQVISDLVRGCLRETQRTRGLRTRIARALRMREAELFPGNGR